MDDAAKERAEARADVPGRKGTLELERGAPATYGTPSERVAQVKAATMRGWKLSGRQMPKYLRSEAPGRVIRAAR